MRPGVRQAAAIAGAVATLVAATVVLDRTRREVDLTQDRALTLTKQTREVVAGVKRDVKVTAFIPRAESGRAEAAALLARYSRLNRHIRYSLKDPAEAPGEAGRLGISLDEGGVAVQAGTVTERAAAVSEVELTSALARVQRARRPTACFTGGHGERSIADTTDPGYEALAKTLRRNGYKVETIDLLTSSTIPPRCEAVVLASPTAPLGDAEQALVAWMAGDGRALVLADPESTVDLNPLTEPMGMHIERGIILEGSDLARLPGDPVTPVVSSYRSGYPFTARLAPTVYPGAQAVSVAKQPDVDGLTVATFAQTSELAYLERRPAGAAFDPAEDIAGPVGIGAAADRSRTAAGATSRARMAVVGDADFASNRFAEDGGNGALAVRLLDWLTAQEDVVAISPNLGRVRPLALTEGRSRYALLLSAVVVPLLFLLAGAMVWALRRGR